MAAALDEEGDPTVITALWGARRSPVNPTTTDIVTIGANPQPLAHRVDPGALLQAVVEKGVTAESVQVAEKLIALDREMRAEDAKASFSRVPRPACGVQAAPRVQDDPDQGRRD